MQKESLSLGRQVGTFFKRFSSIVLPVIAVIVLSLPPARANEVIQKGQLLTLPKCIEIALEKHPSLISAKSTVNIYESRVGQARADYYPQLYWSSTYSRAYPKPSLYGRTHDSYNEYSTALSLSQNLVDFNKTRTQVEIQGMNVTASRSDLDYMTSQVILAVKQAYYGLLQADRARVVSAEAVDGFQKHLDQARAFFQTGVKPKFDVTKAEVDLSNARLNLLKAENNLKVARVNLNNIMGMPDAPEYAVKDDFTFVKEAVAFEEALQRAYNHRADLLSLSAKKTAAEKTIDLAKKGYYPVLTGNANYYYNGDEFPLNKNWTIGATLNFPLFTGLSTKYQVEEAKSALNVLNANEVALRQNIHLEVKQAYLALKEAEDRIDTLDLTVRQANENYDLANGRYASGVGSPIEVTDALLTVSNAKLAYIVALYDYKTAQGKIKKAMGMR